jgi:hypothetical protein
MSLGLNPGQLVIGNLVTSDSTHAIKRHLSKAFGKFYSAWLKANGCESGMQPSGVAPADALVEKPQPLHLLYVK